MNRALRVLSLCAVHLAWAVGARADDKVYLRDGETKIGDVTSVEGDAVQLQQATEYGKVAAPIPIDTIARIEFDETPALESFLKKSERESARSHLKVWDTQRALVRVPGSLAGAVGVATARRLHAGDAPADREKALEIVGFVQDNAWDPAQTAEALALKLQILVASGATDEARKQAEAGLESEDKARRIASSFVLAQILIADYKAFIEENPRWEIDPAVRPEHHRLYNRVFDLLFIPFLEYGLPEEPAARSLWEMAEFHDFDDATTKAANVAKDIVIVYPGTSFRKLAEDYLSKHPPDE